MENIHDMFVLADDADDDDLDDAILLHILRPEEELLGNRGNLYGNFSFNNLNNTQCLTWFRFKKADIPRLVRALQIPEVIVINKITLPGIHGLCMLLRRLSYPNRLLDLETIFGYSNSLISDVMNFVTNLVEETKGHLLNNLGQVPYFNRGKFEEYSQAIHQKGCPFTNCWGFIDGTARGICRPSVQQENYYPGHTKMNCVKYQSVLCPDGIIINLKGASEGGRHDSGILRKFGLYEQLEQNVVFPDKNFLLYGDEGYGLRELLIRPYSIHEVQVDPLRQNFNNEMRVLIVSVEWGFSKVVQ